MGHIRLLNITLFGHHGVTRAERETGTRLVFDVELEADLEVASRSDAVEDTIDYMAVHQMLDEVVRQDRHRLLECLAGAIAERLLARFAVARQVTVRIRKNNLPLAGGEIEVELERVRDGHATTGTAARMAG
ncbi:MAG: dihydroneopterin aldolase [Candidatus Eiseniibacteriota bacterium]|jgi:dihydroneopterin aldolase